MVNNPWNGCSFPVKLWAGGVESVSSWDRCGIVLLPPVLYRPQIPRLVGCFSLVFRVWAALLNGIYQYSCSFPIFSRPCVLLPEGVCLCALTLPPSELEQPLCIWVWKQVFFNFPVFLYLGNQTLPYICTQSCTAHSFSSPSSYRLLLGMVQR